VPLLVKDPAAPGGAIPCTQQFHRTRNLGGGVTDGDNVVGKVSVAQSHSVPHLLDCFPLRCHRAHAVALNVTLEYSFLPFFLFSFSLPNLLEVVQRARPSLNQSGTCPCRSKIQPRRVGQYPAPDSSVALVEEYMRGKRRKVNVLPSDIALAKVSVAL
jgi:hypothetical protein